MYLWEICTLQSTLLLSRHQFVTSRLMNRFRELLGISRPERRSVAGSVVTVFNSSELRPVLHMRVGNGIKNNWLITVA